jgi:hypothetical protein
MVADSYIGPKRPSRKCRRIRNGKSGSIRYFNPASPRRVATFFRRLAPSDAHCVATASRPLLRTLLEIAPNTAAAQHRFCK